MDKKVNEGNEKNYKKLGIFGFLVFSLFVLFLSTATAFGCGYSNEISLGKTANTTDIFYGGEVEYTYIVKNVGNKPIYGVVIWDDKLGVICTIGNLSVNESFTCKKTTYINETTTNIATASGWIDQCLGICTTTNLTVNVYHPSISPSISIKKSANATIINYGESVKYTYNVTNTG
ncbi:MAG: hypothetical protein ACK4YO_02530, partial [Candidatus Altarchaeaceae archaeon]